MKSLPLLFTEPPATPPAPARPRALRHGVALAILIYFLTRLLVWTCTYYGAFLHWRIENRLVPQFAMWEKKFRERPESPNSPIGRSALALLGDFAPLCGFDAEHYATIITGGYRYAPPEPGETQRDKLEQNIAFFPLFPLLARPLAALLGVNAAQIVVVHAASLAAAVLIYLWIRRRIAHDVALWTVAFTFCFPASVYFSYGYAESITLVLFVAALWLMDARRFGLAAVACGLATATRPTALAISLVLLLVYWLNADSAPWPRKLARLAALGAVSVAGLAAYALFLTWSFGSPLVYTANFKAGWTPATTRASWLELLTFSRVWEQFKYFGALVAFVPPVGLLNAANTLMWNMPLNFFVLFLSLGGWRRAPRSFRPLLLLGPFIFLQSYAACGAARFGLEPIARYMAVATPALVVLAVWTLREWRAGARHILLTLFVLVQCAWAFRFGLREWSG